MNINSTLSFPAILRESVNKNTHIKWFISIDSHKLSNFSGGCKTPQGQYSTPLLDVQESTWLWEVLHLKKNVTLLFSYLLALEVMRVTWKPNSYLLRSTWARTRCCWLRATSLVWTQGPGHQQTRHCSKCAQTFTVQKLGCPRAEVLLPLVWADVWPHLGYIMHWDREGTGLANWEP